MSMDAVQVTAGAPESNVILAAPAQRGVAVRIYSGIARFARAKPVGMFGAIVMLLWVVMAVTGPWLAPYQYDDFNIPERLQGPSWGHLFGTDEQGRDIFSRVIFGARTTVMVGFGAVAISTCVASVAGIVSGFFHGSVDVCVQRVVDISLAFPGLIFIIFMASIFGSDTFTLVVSLGLIFSASATRLVRSQTLTVTATPYVEAARALGCSNLRILVRHVAPNVLFVIIISASVQIGAVILVESSLSFLGLGTPPPFPSWGRMLQDAQSQMRYHPHLALFPGAAIALTVYSTNMLGDALRDWWDPRLRGS